MCSRLREKSMNQTTNLPAFLIRTTSPCINDIILSQLNSLALFFQLTLNIYKYSNCRNGEMMVKERGKSFLTLFSVGSGITLACGRGPLWPG